MILPISGWDTDERSKVNEFYFQLMSKNASDACTIPFAIITALRQQQQTYSTDKHIKSEQFHGFLADRTALGSTPGRCTARQQLWASCWHPCASITKQYNLVPAKGRWCSATGKVTVGLALHWPCVTRPESLLRLWRYINHLLTYIL